MEQDKIILIGAGNVAHHLAAALLKAGENLCQIYSRSMDSARELGTRTGVSYTNDLSQVLADGDIYIFCVSDDAISPVLKSINVQGNPLLLHTSGSVPVEVFAPYSRTRGVLYPLQTFSKDRDLDFREIPLFIEGSSTTLRKLAKKLSDHVYSSHFEQRRMLHLAAIFACNFPNILYHVASNLLDGNDIPFRALRPLIFETAHKVMTMSPEEAQTGPAKRGDEGTLLKHKHLLKSVDRDILTLYSLLSDLVKKEVEKPTVTAAEQTKQESGEMLTLW
jgi:predicted short-subunit dehydrogenase-like oxidoreductase (DUF2520 family)